MFVRLRLFQICRILHVQHVIQVSLRQLAQEVVYHRIKQN
uniref:Hypotheticial protein n=1 Tax=Schistosoma japonicum TaxID=6182 RepID=C1LDL8_SCHJA|nr:hypotheticial protein [Schistosoma japonicum]